MKSPRGRPGYTPPQAAGHLLSPDHHRTAAGHAPPFPAKPVGCGWRRATRRAVQAGASPTLPLPLPLQVANVAYAAASLGPAQAPRAWAISLFSHTQGKLAGFRCASGLACCCHSIVLCCTAVVPQAQAGRAAAQAGGHPSDVCLCALLLCAGSAVAMQHDMTSWLAGPRGCLPAW